MLCIRVPATSANLGPGVDSLGLALQLYNLFKVEKIDSGFETIIIDNITGEERILSREDNLFFQALNRIFRLQGKSPDGIRLIEEVEIPFARGLGSSATAIIAGLIAGNILLGKPLTQNEIIKVAVEMEGHPDNVLPALLGGFVINVNPVENLVYKKIALDDRLEIVIVIPDFELKTLELRNVLPIKVDHQDAIFNLSRAALLTSCFLQNNLDGLKTAMEDRLHQIYRSELIPGFEKVIEDAYNNGAAGVALSGAGPSLISFTKANAHDLGCSMVSSFNKYNVKSRYIVTRVDNRGLTVEEKNVLSEGKNLYD